MNEFSAKKLGEVLAFAVVGTETFEKGGKALSSVWGEDAVHDYLEKFEGTAERIKTIAKNDKVEDVVMKKLDATGSKLRSMRDLYVGDQWDNPTELLEWSGFFEGAAIVHWYLVEGVANTTKNDELAKLSEENLNSHKELLYKATLYLNEVGKNKSK